MTALNTFSDVLRHAVEEGAKTEYTELMLQAAELLDAKVYTLPAAPVEGLDTVAYRYRHVDYVNWSYSESEHPRSDIHNEELVTRSQADVIIAAKDAKIADLENELSSFRSSFKEQTSLKADNAALTARVKELEGGIAVADGDRAASRTSLELTRHRAEALETQLAAARKALKTIADAPAWGFPEKWETTPAEVRQIARAALEVRP